MAKKVVSIELIDHKDEVLAQFHGVLNDWLDAIGEDAADTASQKAPYRTGNLRNSIGHVVHSGESVEIGTNVEYAPVQEFGRRDGTIKGKHYIRFGATAHTQEYKALLERMMKGG